MDDLVRVRVERPGEAHPVDPQRREQALLDDGLVGLSGDDLDEDRQQAEVHVRVLVRRPGIELDSGVQAAGGGLAARLDAAGEERVVELAEPGRVREQLAHRDRRRRPAGHVDAEVVSEQLADRVVEGQRAVGDELEGDRAGDHLGDAGDAEAIGHVDRLEDHGHRGGRRRRRGCDRRRTGRLRRRLRRRQHDVRRVAVAERRGVDRDAVDADGHPEGEVAGAEQAVLQVRVDPRPLDVGRAGRACCSAPRRRQPVVEPSSAASAVRAVVVATGVTGGAVADGGAVAESSVDGGRRWRRGGRLRDVVGVAASGREAAHAAAADRDEQRRHDGRAASPPRRNHGSTSSREIAANSAAPPAMVTATARRGRRCRCRRR